MTTRADTEHESTAAPERAATADSSDLGSKVATGSLVTILSSVLKLLLTVGSVAVLARLLTPLDYGITALAYPIITLLTVVGDLGLSMATMQRKELSHQQSTMIFWVGLGAGLVLTVLTAAAAGPMAWFFETPQVEGVMVALAFGFILNAVKAQHEALLRRHLRLKTLAINEVVALTASIAVAVAMAGRGAGYWALVAMPLVQSGIAGGLAWLTMRWRPGLPRWEAGMPSIMHFGLYLTGFNLVNFFNRQFDNVLIGWKWGPGPLGHYALAYRLLMLPLLTIHHPLTGVAVPALSRLIDDPDRYRRYFLTALATISFVFCPLMAGAGLAADLLIPAFLGDQWQEAAAIFSALAGAGLVQMITNTNGWLYASAGRTDRQFWWRVCTAPIVVAGFVIGLEWGPVGVATGYAAVTAALSPIGIAHALRVTPIGIAAYGKALLPTATVTLAVSAGVGLCRIALPEDMGAPMALAIVILSAALAFLATSWALFGLGAARQRLQELHGLLTRNAGA